MEQASIDQTLIGPEDLAKWLQVSPRTLQQWRQRRTGPPYIRTGYRQIRYEISDVKSWLATRKSV